MKIIDKPADNEFQPNEALYAKLIPDDGMLLSILSLLEELEAVRRSMSCIVSIS
jgi:hypothetical protein